MRSSVVNLIDFDQTIHTSGSALNSSYKYWIHTRSKTSRLYYTWIDCVFYSFSKIHIHISIMNHYHWINPHTDHTENLCHFLFSLLKKLIRLNLVHSPNNKNQKPMAAQIRTEIEWKIRWKISICKISLTMGWLPISIILLILRIIYLAWSQARARTRACMYLCMCELRWIIDFDNFCFWWSMNWSTTFQ